MKTVRGKSGSVALKGSGATIRKMKFYYIITRMINWEQRIVFLRTVRKTYGSAQKMASIYLTERRIHLLLTGKILYMGSMKTGRAIS
jgi:hypothetical protein